MDLTSPAFANRALARQLRDAILIEKAERIRRASKAKKREPCPIDEKALIEDRRELVKICKRTVNERLSHEPHLDMFYLVAQYDDYDMESHDDTVYFSDMYRFTCCELPLDQMEREDYANASWSEEYALHAAVPWKDLKLAEALQKFFPYHIVEDLGRDEGIRFTYMHYTYKILATIPTPATKPNEPIAKFARLDGDYALRTRMREMLNPNPKKKT